MSLPEAVEIAIVGAGFGGLGMAIRLKQQGMHDFVVLERASDVGGTWAANTYPGCQCDVPSNLYSFSFAPNPAWTHSYPLQPQIQHYLRRCAERFGILEHTHLQLRAAGGGLGQRVRPLADRDLERTAEREAPRRRAGPAQRAGRAADPGPRRLWRDRLPHRPLGP